MTAVGLAERPSPRRAAAGRSASLRILAIPFATVGQLAIARAGGTAVYADFSVALSVIGVVGVIAAMGMPAIATRQLATAGVAQRAAVTEWVLRRQAVGLAVVVCAFLPIAGPLLRALNVETSSGLVMVAAANVAAGVALALGAALAKGAGRVTLGTVAESAWGSIAVACVLAVAAIAGWLDDVGRTLVFRAGAMLVGVVVVVAWWQLVHAEVRTDAAGPGEAAGCDSAGAVPGDVSGSDAAGEPTSPVWVAPSTGAMLRRAAPLVGIALATWGQTNAPLWWLGRRGADGATSLFSAGQRMAAVATIPANVLLTLHAAALARRAAGEAGAGYDANLRRRVGHATAIVTLYAAGLVVAGPWLTRRLWDLPGGQVRVVLLLLVGAPLVLTVTGPCGYALIMAGRERLSLAATLFGSAASVACLVAVPIERPGVRAAVSVIVGAAVTNGSNLAMARRVLGLNSLAAVGWPLGRRRSS